MTNKSILEQNFTECLKLTDKIIFISPAVLGFGLILSVNTQSSEQDFAIPILDTHVSSLVTALWLIIILHFCNGVRFIFVVARAVSIAKRLPEDTLAQLLSYPAFITSHWLAEIVASLSMASMVGAISLRLGFNHWWFTVPAIFFSSLGFVIGAVLAEQKLNFELKA